MASSVVSFTETNGVLLPGTPPLALARLRCDNGVVRDVVVKHACDRHGQRAHVAVAERDGVAHTHTQRLGEGIVEERLPRRGHC